MISNACWVKVGIKIKIIYLSHSGEVLIFQSLVLIVESKLSFNFDLYTEVIKDFFIFNHEYWLLNPDEGLNCELHTYIVEKYLGLNHECWLLSQG